MIDAHCHILPNVDDGPKSLQDSVEMLKTAKANGIDKIVFTSHIKEGFANLAEHKQAYEQIKPLAADMGIQTELGAEVNWRKLAGLKLKDTANYTLGKSNKFLLEFSLAKLPSRWETIVYELQCQGLKVIIAHPERYPDVQNNPDIVEDFKNMDCLTMISGNYIDKKFLGRFGKKIKPTTKKLLKMGLVDIIASDAHRVSSYEHFNQGLEYAKNLGFDQIRAEELLLDIFY